MLSCLVARLQLQHMNSSDAHFLVVVAFLHSYGIQHHAAGCLVLQRTRALAWCPAVSGPSYMFATASDMDVYLWGVNPYSALVSSK